MDEKETNSTLSMENWITIFKNKEDCLERGVDRATYVFLAFLGAFCTSLFGLITTYNGNIWDINTIALGFLIGSFIGMLVVFIEDSKDRAYKRQRLHDLENEVYSGKLKNTDEILKRLSNLWRIDEYRDINREIDNIDECDNRVKLKIENRNEYKKMVEIRNRKRKEFSKHYKEWMKILKNTK